MLISGYVTLGNASCNLCRNEIARQVATEGNCPVLQYLNLGGPLQLAPRSPTCALSFCNIDRPLAKQRENKNDRIK